MCDGIIVGEEAMMIRGVVATAAHAAVMAAVAVGIVDHPSSRRRGGG